MATEETKSYDEVPGLEGLPAIADELYGTLQNIKQLEEIRDELKGQIRAKLEAARLKAVSCPALRADVDGTVIETTCRVTLADGRVSRRLDVDKLQKNGVAIKVIEASYVTTTAEPSVRLYTKEGA